MQVIVPLDIYEELQHVVVEEVELVLVEASPLSIIEQQPEEESPFILIVGFAERDGQVPTVIGFLMDTPMAFSTERDSISRFHCTPRIESLSHDVMRLDAIFRLAAHTAIGVPLLDEATPLSKNPLYRALLLHCGIQSQFALPDS
ncbi:hypothetical protein D9M70_496160 [compost metagenome]